MQINIFFKDILTEKCSKNVQILVFSHSNKNLALKGQRKMSAWQEDEVRFKVNSKVLSIRPHTLVREEPQIYF